ncbi:MAG TPA: SGNH/GDSL hydrolase family protein [Alphaproteobacteria bacterium]
MIQILIFGSSTAYGVGGPHGGLGDMLKTHLHQIMYSENGPGEVCEVYNFAKPGATADFVAATFPDQLEYYGKDGRKRIAIVHIGSNNAKAVNAPDQFVSTPDEFTDLMSDLLKDIKASVDEIFVLGYRPCDESKTAPKQNLITGYSTYFTNERLTLFNNIQRKICTDLQIKFIEVSMDENKWTENCLYKDGLHPNHQGHQALFESIKDLIHI